MFISFEGIEAVGKSTQISLLFEYLKSHNKTVSLLKEPGGTLLGEALCHIIKNLDDDISALAELCLFSASRIELVRKILIPKLKRKEFVLCDRYCDSTLIYQGYARGLDLELVKDFNSLATKGIIPDKTILIDLAVEQSLLRLKKRSTKDRIEKEKLSFHQKVREGFLKLARQEKNRFIVVDGSQDQNDHSSSYHSKPRVMIEKFIETYPIASSLIDAQKRQCLAHAFLIYGNDASYLDSFADEWLEVFYFILFDGQKSWSEVKNFSKQEFNPFFFLVQPENKKNEISVGRIRRLRDDLQIKPANKLYKVILVREAHCLSQKSQNALLKILEEPYDNTIFLLLTEFKEVLLTTITSRCQRIPIFSYNEENCFGSFAHFKFFSGVNNALKMSKDFKQQLNLIEKNVGTEIKKMEEELNSTFMDEKDKKIKISVQQSLLVKKKTTKLLSFLEGKLFEELKACKSDVLISKAFASLFDLKFAFKIDFLNFDLAIDNFFLIFS